MLSAAPTLGTPGVDNIYLLRITFILMCFFLRFSLSTFAANEVSPT